LTIQDKVNKTERNPSVKQLARRKRTIELSEKGLTNEQINKALHEEHYATSLHTVSDDLNSITAEERLAELNRQQKADITLANNDYRTRLEYRGRLIENLTPRVNINKNEQIGKIVVEVVDSDTPEPKREESPD
jgi:hypothetical protein